MKPSIFLLGATLIFIGGISTHAEDPARPVDPMWKNAVCRNSAMPRSVISKRLEGHVSLLFDISEDGKVGNIRITESVPNDRMDYSVQRALSRWEYFPHFENGIAVPRKDLAITFTFGADKNKSCTHTALPDLPSTAGDPTDPDVARKQCFKLMMPAAAAQKNESGTVTLAYDVTVDGEVENARILKSPTSGLFDQDALVAVNRWKYFQFQKAGTPIPRPGMQVSLHFGYLPSDAKNDRCSYAPWDALSVIPQP